MIQLSFVVPVRNDADGVERCLKSIARTAAVFPHEVILVDNGSIDGSSERGHALGASVLKAQGRVARLRNLGAASAKGRLLAFVDADHEVAAYWADAAIELMGDVTVAAAGAPYHPPLAANWVQRSYNLLRDHTPGVRDAAWLGSGNLVVRRECFEAVDGFDNSLETCEDVDLCQRFRRHGFRVVSDSRLLSTHYGDPRTLRRLFLSELWRGRDNLRVSLRQPVLRELPSAIIPVVDLAAALIAIVGGLWGGYGSVIALAAVLLILAFASLRAWRMAGRLRRVTLTALGQIACVALCFDVARALALAVRLPHRRVAGPVMAE